MQSSCVLPHCQDYQNRERSTVKIISFLLKRVGSEYCNLHLSQVGERWWQSEGYSESAALPITFPETSHIRAPQFCAAPVGTQ